MAAAGRSNSFLNRDKQINFNFTGTAKSSDLQEILESLATIGHMQLTTDSSPSNMIQKLNIVSTLSALILFFLPWIDIRCSNQNIATQSGIQTIYGGGSAPKEQEPLSAYAKQMDGGASKKDESLGVSGLMSFALVVVVGAVIASFLIFIGNRACPPDLTGVLCAIALVAITAQMVIGFPVAGKISDELTKGGGHASGAGDFPAAEMTAAMVQVVYLPSIYLELIALGIPTLILANRLLDKLKKQDT